MGTPHTSRNQGKILKFHGIERVKVGKLTSSKIDVKCHILLKLSDL